LPFRHISCHYSAIIDTADRYFDYAISPAADFAMMAAFALRFSFDIYLFSLPQPFRQRQPADDISVRH
jgi:hypothetical protein